MTSFTTYISSTDPWFGAEAAVDRECHSCGDAFPPASRDDHYCSDVCRDDQRASRLRVLGEGREEAAAWLAEHGGAWS